MESRSLQLLQMRMIAVKSWRWIGIGCALLSAAGSIAAGEIRFRGESAPKGNVVRLGDVAEVVDDDPEAAAKLSAAELCPAPSPGEKLMLSSRDICDRLRMRGVNLSGHSLSGASRVTIYSASQPTAKPNKELPPSESLRIQAEARVRAAIVEYLQNYTEATAAWSIDFKLSDDQVRLICRASAKPALQGGQEPWTGEQQFQIAIGTADSVRQFALSATIAQAAPVVVARRAIGRGVVLNRADVELRMPTTSEGAEGAFLKLEDVVGRETARSLSEGSSLTADDIRAPLLVRKRDVVTVYARSPGIRVRVTGRAVEDGALGEVITVESLADRKTFFARVSGAQEVEVYARADQATAAAASRAEAMAANH